MLATSTDGLAAIFRAEVDDQFTDPQNPSDVDCLWKEVEIYGYMTEAADAVARDVEGLYKIAQYPVVAGVQLVPLPKSILHVREARLLTAQLKLHPRNIDDVASLPSDDYGFRVESQFWTSTGVPRFFVRDYDRRGILLSPIPTSNDTIELQCTTTLGAPLVAGAMLPFLEVPDQRLMLLKMKALAYLKQDADTQDLKRSAAFDKKYTDMATDRKAMLEAYRRTPGQIQQWDIGYGGG